MTYEMHVFISGFVLSMTENVWRIFPKTFQFYLKMQISVRGCPRYNTSLWIPYSEIFIPKCISSRYQENNSLLRSNFTFDKIKCTSLSEVSQCHEFLCFKVLIRSQNNSEFYLLLFQYPEEIRKSQIIGMIPPKTCGAQMFTKILCDTSVVRLQAVNTFSFRFHRHCCV